MAKANGKGANINDILKKKPLKAPDNQKLKETPAKVATVVPVKKAEVKKTAPTKPSEKSEKGKDELFKYLDAGSIPEKLILLTFVRWCALPKALRDPETQSKFCEKYGLNKDTLTNWKYRQGFYEEVRFYQDRFVLSFGADLWYSFIRTAKKNGDPRALKLYAQRFEGWSEKVRMEDETPDNPLDEQLKQEMANAIHNIGLAVIKEGYEDNDEDPDTE